MVWVVVFDGVNVRCGDQFVYFLSGRMNKFIVFMCLFKVFCFIGVFNDRSLCFNWIVMQCFCFMLYFYQVFVYYWVFQVVGIVKISGVVGIVWVVVRFMVWQIWMGMWIVSLLGFSGDQIVFDVDFLVVGVGVVYFVGRVDDFVMLLMLVIFIFLVMVGIEKLVMFIGKGFIFLFEVVKLVQEFIYWFFFVGVCWFFDKLILLMFKGKVMF